MRNSFLLLSLLLSSLAFSQSAPLVASCCSKNEGRCTGSAYCTACSNCSRCAHCGSGGSCGVCSSRNTYYAEPKKKATKTTYSTRSMLSAVSGDILQVSVATVNVRKGPGTKYGIIEKMAKGQEVVFHELLGNWAYVTVRSTGSKGYVYMKSLK